MTTSENSHDSSGKEVPLTINFDMTKQIGKAKVIEDEHGLRIEATIWDEDAKRVILGDELTHLSIDTAHFVRDKEKESKLPWQH